MFFTCFLILQQAFSGEWLGDRFFAVALRKKTHREEPIEFQLSVYVSGPKASAARTEEFIRFVTEQHVRAEPGVEVWFQRNDTSPSLPSCDLSYSDNFKVLRYEGKTYHLSSPRASKCFEIIYKAAAAGMDRVDGLTLRSELAMAGHESPKAIRDIFNSPESKRVWKDLIDATPKGYYGLKI